MVRKKRLHIYLVLFHMELVVLDGGIWVTAFMILLFMMCWEHILAVVLDKGIYMLMAFLGAMEMEM
jgi:hypothetical protein